MQEFKDGWGTFTDVPKGSWWEGNCEGLSFSMHLYIHHTGRIYHGTRTVYAVQTSQHWRDTFVFPNMQTGFHLLDLLGIFVADENNNWINVNAVEPFDGMWGDVKQTVTALHPNKGSRTSVTPNWKPRQSLDNYLVSKHLTHKMQLNIDKLLNTGTFTSQKCWLMYVVQATVIAWANLEIKLKSSYLSWQDLRKRDKDWVPFLLFPL